MPSPTYRQLLELSAWKLADLNHESPFEIGKNRDFIQYDSRYLFIHQKQEMGHTWKMHVSVHPDDLEKAWDDVFSEVLTQYAMSFKLSNCIVLDKSIKKAQKELGVALQERNELEALYHAYLHADDKGALENEIIDVFQKLDEECRQYCRFGPPENFKSVYKRRREMPRLSRDRLKVDDQVAFSREFIEAKKHHLDWAHDSYVRVREGMQVTIYMPKSLTGDEKDYQWLAGLLEERLREKGVRPGHMYKTDRAIGEYCSIRHPGVNTYYEGTSTTQDYNPDKVDDPFQSFLDEDNLAIIRPKLVELKKCIQEMSDFNLRFLMVGKYISLYQQYIALKNSLPAQQQCVIDEMPKVSELYEGILGTRLFFEEAKLRESASTWKRPSPFAELNKIADEIEAEMHKETDSTSNQI